MRTWYVDELGNQTREIRSRDLLVVEPQQVVLGSDTFRRGLRVVEGARAGWRGCLTDNYYTGSMLRYRY